MPETTRRPGRPTLSASGAPAVTLVVRLDPALMDRIDTAAARRKRLGKIGNTRSDYVRFALGQVLKADGVGE